MMINNLNELARYLGTENIAKAVFKGTECGCVFQAMPEDRGVIVAGYAEGSDADLPPHELEYPFTGQEWGQALQEADEEGCEMWHEWNSGELDEEVGC